MTDFHDVRLPEEIEQGAVGGPSFYTNITSISSGAEQRTSTWDRQRLTWQVGYGIQTNADYQQLLQFFYARRGRAYSFRFKDFSDYTATDAAFGVGTGTLRVFRLVKPYPSGSTTYNRIITHPVTATIVLKDNGVIIDPSKYDVEAFGIIRFHVGQAPLNAHVLTWSGEFDVPVRFDIDQMNLTLYALAAGDIESNGLPIIEVREQINNPPTAVVITNILSNINERTSTASHIPVATFELIDDDLGVNAVGLTGTNPTYFEVVVDAGTRTGTLYIKAGAVLDYLVHTSLSVNIDTWDTVIGARPSATATYTIAINNVADSPVVTLTNETHALLAGTSTASRVHLADISYTVDLGQTVILTLTGTDAGHFEIFGGNLYLKAGEDTASVHHYIDFQLTFTPSVAAATVVPFALTIGIVAGSITYDTPGTYSFTVPQYSTFEIDVWAAGCATWGYTPGTPTAPTAPAVTYVRNDQTVTTFHRWTVQPSRMTDNPDAWTAGYKLATAVQDSVGIGASLTAANSGNVGGGGIAPQIKDSTFDVASGNGGSQVQLDATIVPGGVGVHAAAPPTGGIATANGNPGTSPGTGASGGVYRKDTVVSSQVITGSGAAPPAPSQTFTAMAGAGSGMFAKYTWTYGSVQIGSGAGYTAPAPAVGDILTIVIGVGGVKGSGTVNGADGGHGKARLAWS